MTGAVGSGGAAVRLALLTAAAVFAFACLTWAQVVGAAADTDTTVVNDDTPADTVGGVGIVNDTAAAASAVTDAGDDMDDFDDDDLILADADSAKGQIQKPNLVSRREYDYKRQTRLALVMMVFIAVIFATSQSWNPR